MLKKAGVCLLCTVIALLSVVVPVRAQETWETPSGVAAENFEQVCDEYFAEQVGHTIPGASVAVVSNGKIVFEKGYGYSDIEKKLPSDPKKTVYEYGSVSKLFTWVSLMKLKEEGKVDFNTDIRQYLPEDFPLPMSYEKPITILDLMNHQAGFDDYLIHLFGKPDEIISLKQSLMEHKVQQVHEPGFASSYSNYGAGLAGYIVENVTGEPDYQYIEQEVMQAAGMNQAVIHPDLSDREDILQKKAKVYSGENGAFKEENWSYVSMYPAGAANGTVEELSSFAIALLDEEKHPLFQKRESQTELLTNSSGAAAGVAGIAHGFIEYDGETPVYWHNGGTDHSSSFFALVPEKDFAVILCTNCGEIDAIQNFGFELLQKRNVVLETPQENLPDASVVAGDYLDFREDHRGITKILFLGRYLSPIRVRAVNSQEIEIAGSRYIQVEPYIFQEADTGIKASFLVENGQVVKYSEVLDFVKIPQWQIAAAWMKTVILFLLAVSLFVTLGIILIAVIRKKFHKQMWLYLSGMALWGMLVTNVMVIAGKIEAWNSFDAIQGFLFLNRGLGIALSIGSLAGIVCGMKGTKAGWWYRLFSAISLMAVLVLWTLGVFSIYY